MGPGCSCVLGFGDKAVSEFAHVGEILGVVWGGMGKVKKSSRRGSLGRAAPTAKAAKAAKLGSVKKPKRALAIADVSVCRVITENGKAASDGVELRFRDRRLSSSWHGENFLIYRMTVLDAQRLLKQLQIQVPPCDN